MFLIKLTGSIEIFRLLSSLKSVTYRTFRKFMYKSVRSQPTSSEVLTCYLNQCNEPPWTSYFVKYSSIRDDQWGKSHFNWRVGKSNYHILRTGCYPYIKYHCTKRKEEDLSFDDRFFRFIKVFNLGIPCLAYGMAATRLIKHVEIVHTDRGSVEIYFLYKENKGSQYYALIPENNGVSIENLEKVVSVKPHVRTMILMKKSQKLLKSFKYLDNVTFSRFFFRPAASEVLTSYLSQCNEPPWTSYFVKRISVSNDQWGRSHFNWEVGKSNYQILRTGCFPYIKYHCSKRATSNLFLEDLFFRTIKVINLGILTLAYGLAATQMISHVEIVNTSRGPVKIYFLYAEDKGSHY